jgi:glycosyltransferase involved in cell wall biosynthesis
LILGDIGSLRELWDGVAIFVSPDDPNQLFGAINHLIDCPEERSRYGTIARLRAAEYQPSKMADQYVCAYNSIS